MKKRTAKLIPLVTTGFVPAATMTSALLAPLALADTGDLDPAFGDVGRLGPILNGPAWSLQSLEDDSILLGGGGLAYFYYYWYDTWYEPSNFVSLLSDTGATDPNFNALSLEGTQIFDVAQQPDGQVVAVGRKVSRQATRTTLNVVRLQADGQRDATFANGGIFELSIADHGDHHMATSVLVEADGRIVVAGSRDDDLIVLRLLPDGSFDDSFATAGIFVGPNTYDYSDGSAGARTNLLRTADGDYRVTASNASGCQVVAITVDGAPDDTFGTAGIANVDAASGPSDYCNAMAAQANGRLLLAGSAAGQAFAARLLANGQPDTGFSAGAVANEWTEATSVAASDDGKIIVAGKSADGASIMRLTSNGSRDGLFGNAGSTLIDLQSDSGTAPAVHDMVVRTDGSVLAAGGEYRSNKAFVVRLLGANGGDSPGVLGVVEQAVIDTAEGNDEIVVNVRRTGGASGSVSLAYGTTPVDAESGQDFEAVSGRLSWADGDTAEQQIHVPILSDTVVEQDEFFFVTLGDVQGGAGLGTTNATIAIAPDGGPFGQITFWDTVYTIFEANSVEIGVARNYYSTGAVSVTLTPVPGTATAGMDFDATPITVSWADGESGWKPVVIPLVNDTIEEPTETFTVELSDPTGGAVLGELTTVTIQIFANDQPRPTPSSKSGGGALDFLSLLLLGAIRLLRRARAAVRSRSAKPGRR